MLGQVAGEGQADVAVVEDRPDHAGRSHVLQRREGGERGRDQGTDEEIKCGEKAAENAPNGDGGKSQGKSLASGAFGHRVLFLCDVRVRSY